MQIQEASQSFQFGTKQGEIVYKLEEANIAMQAI